MTEKREQYAGNSWLHFQRREAAKMELDTPVDTDKQFDVHIRVAETDGHN